MAGNTDPIYSRIGDIQSNGALIGSTATTAADGTGTLYPVWQADATNGGFLQKLVFHPVGTSGASAVAATSARIFISNITGSWTGNTAANTWLYQEVTLGAVTTSLSAATTHYEVPLNIAVPPGYRIVVGFGTSTGAATTGYVVTGVGGKY